MKYPLQEEINAIAKKYIELRDKAAKTKSKKIKEKFKEHQAKCIDKLKYLILFRTYKYKQFSNHQDLEQDGFEALLLALKTYDYKKGNFSWWADKYIATKVSRSANAHSTIRFPLKKAKEMRPYKISTIPTIIDVTPNAIETIEETEQTDSIQKAIEKLPEQHQKVIKMTYGFNGIKQHSIGTVTKRLSISRPQCLKILEEAKEKLKEILSSD